MNFMARTRCVRDMVVQISGDLIAIIQFRATIPNCWRLDNPTGRNHHRVGFGQIAELANDWDGYTGVTTD